MCVYVCVCVCVCVCVREREGGGRERQTAGATVSASSNVLDSRFDQTQTPGGVQQKANGQESTRGELGTYSHDDRRSLPLPHHLEVGGCKGSAGAGEHSVIV